MSLRSHILGQLSVLLTLLATAQLAAAAGFKLSSPQIKDRGTLTQEHHNPARLGLRVP